ncbi:GntR family transcriptional regulator [Pseudoruegeria sp. SK021]|uniref:GntR family transcriptional regulator n=1 Tax=Pseudoruegeria sp. SK021 TaxID=1933035 RepID=UPI000A2529FA|nr:GntR family transcriptional regulator [Pseudoruegeria sp. SK021]OSP53806.1 hypothetical protein BV911_15980 [Pseudoruegeria sp. SK021]
MDDIKRNKPLSGIGQVYRKETLGTQVAGELRSAVMSGLFRPGELLKIRDVAQALKVSVTPAREALLSLVSAGIFETGANGTIRVPDLSIERIIEVRKIRCALECMAAREAFPRLSTGAIKRLKRLNGKMFEANEKGDTVSIAKINWEFHFEIYRLSEAPYLNSMIENCWLLVGSYCHVLYPNFTEFGFEHHHQIILAAERKDAVAFEACLKEDIITASERLINFVERDREVVDGGF